MLNEDYLIPILIGLPLAGGLIMLLPVARFDQYRTAWWHSLVITLLSSGVGIFALTQFNFDQPETLQFAGAIDWITAYHLSFSYGVDSIALWLILLTTLLMPLVILGSKHAITRRAREYYCWLLILQAAMLGTFAATDIIFFYLCFEFSLMPLYLLIGIFGSDRRLQAAKLFFIYTFTGSMLTLAGILYIAHYHAVVLDQGWSFHITTLYNSAVRMPMDRQLLVFCALVAGFAVKIPLFPFHTWLPLAHTEAPTAGSVLLAGVLLKLGTYGLIRFAIPMTPEATVRLAPVIAVLAIIGILYAALVCWVQTDIKRLIAYSSISHLGFCVLGLFALDESGIGPVGAVMYMINHGLSTGALFLCIGMLYERLHTRDMNDFAGLARIIPVWSFFMMLFIFASVGLPGLNGFIGEFLTLLGTFHADQILGIAYAAVAGTGIILAAIYLLYMAGRVMFGSLKLPPGFNSSSLSDLNFREIASLTPLALLCLVLGLYPLPVLDSLEPPIALLTSSACDHIAAVSNNIEEHTVADSPPTESATVAEHRPPEPYVNLHTVEEPGT